MKYIYALLTVVFLYSCGNDHISTGSNGHKMYTYPPMHWSIQVPDNWIVMDDSQLDKLTYKSQNFYEADVIPDGKKVEKKIIYGVRKAEEDMNSCYVFMREYRKGDDAPDLRPILDQQYKQYSKGSYTAEKSITKKNIAGREFDVAVLTVSYNGAPHFTYTTYSTMVSNTNFGTSIVANNKADEQMLTGLFEQSVPSLN